MHARLIPLMLVLATTAGCSSLIVGPTKKEVDKHHEASQVLLKDAQRGEGPVRTQQKPAIEYVAGLWLPTTKPTSAETPKIPNKDLADRRVTFNRSFSGIQDAAEKITTLTGIPVILAQDVTTPTSGTPGTGAAVPAAIPAGIPGGFPFGAGGAGSPNPVVVYDGTLSGFLDTVATRYELSWEWTDKSIRFYRYVTKTFQLAALSGDTKLESSVSIGGSGGAGAGGSGGSTGGSSGTASTTATASFTGQSIWTTINASLKEMLSPSGSLSVTPSTGSITVTDTTQVVNRVENFIKVQNAALNKQVTVNVRVLSVNLNSADEYGINWGALYSSLSGNFGFDLANSLNVSSNASKLTLKVLGTSGTGQPGDANVTAWRGSQAIISALSSQGDVSQITSASLTTLNNQPAPLQVGRQTAYLASSTTTTTQGVGSTTTLQPGLINTGFSMSMVPFILDKGELILQFSIDISSLLNISTVSSGTSSIQTPEVDVRHFLQRVKLNSGDTLVMSGFEQSDINAKTQGIGRPDNLLLGGGANRSKSSSIIVILIQPVVLGAS